MSDEKLAFATELESFDFEELADGDFSTVLMSLSFEPEMSDRILNLTQSDSFASLGLVVNTFSHFIAAGVDIADLESLAAEMKTQIQWKMTAQDFNSARFSSILSHFNSENMDSEEINGIIQTVKELKMKIITYNLELITVKRKIFIFKWGFFSISTLLKVNSNFSVTLLESSYSNIFQKCVMHFLASVDSTIANRLAGHILAADFVTNNVQGHSFTFLVDILSELGEAAAVDFEQLRRHVIFSDKFSTLVFTFEILHQLLEAGAMAAERETPAVFAAIESNIVWDGGYEALNFELFNAIVSSIGRVWETLKLKHTKLGLIIC